MGSDASCKSDSLRPWRNFVSVTIRTCAHRRRTHGCNERRCAEASWPPSRVLCASCAISRGGVDTFGRRACMWPAAAIAALHCARDHDIDPDHDVDASTSYAGGAIAIISINVNSYVSTCIIHTSIRIHVTPCTPRTHATLPTFRQGMDPDVGVDALSLSASRVRVFDRDHDNVQYLRAPRVQRLLSLLHHTSYHGMHTVTIRVDVAVAISHHRTRIGRATAAAAEVDRSAGAHSLVAHVVQPQWLARWKAQLVPFAVQICSPGGHPLLPSVANVLSQQHARLARALYGTTAGRGRREDAAGRGGGGPLHETPLFERSALQLVEP